MRRLLARRTPGRGARLWDDGGSVARSAITPRRRASAIDLRFAALDLARRPSLRRSPPMAERRAPVLLRGADPSSE